MNRITALAIRVLSVVAGGSCALGAPVTPDTRDDPAATVLRRTIADTARDMTTLRADMTVTRWSLDGRGNALQKIDEDVGTVRMAAPGRVRIDWSKFVVV